jgi:hypothetical protein
LTICTQTGNLSKGVKDGGEVRNIIGATNTIATSAYREVRAIGVSQEEGKEALAR